MYGMEHLAVTQHFAHALALQHRELLLVAMQPALDQLAVDARGMRGLEPPHFLGAGSLERARIARQHIVTMRDYRVYGIEIALDLRRERDFGRDFLYLRETDYFHQADIHPADIEFPPFV